MCRPLSLSRQKYQILDDELVAHLEAHPDERQRFVFLEPHADFKGFWRVEAFDRDLYFNLGDIIGSYRAVAPSGLDELLGACEEHGYEVVFFEDPTSILGDFAALNEPPDIALNSTMPNTVGGLLPYQVQGFNFLKGLHGGVAMWSTGTGKTVLASALVQHHVEHQTFDICWFVVKSHNKVNTQRSIKALTGLDAVVVGGEKKVRQALYSRLADVDEPTIVVTNYEKFRVDHEDILPLFERRTLCIWDEMPTKLKTRTTQLYKAVCQCLYTTAAPQTKRGKERPESLRQYMLSATPIENDPEDWFNCVRLLDPEVYGTVADFRNEYVARWSFFDQNKPESWHRLDKMGLKAAHIVHQVDKDDIDIASQFPEVIDTPLYIDWDESDRKVYDKFTKELMKDADEDINVVSAIGIMRMLCDAPSMVTDSAARREAFEDAVEAWFDEGGAMPTASGSEAAMRLLDKHGAKLTDEKHTKRETLRELVCEQHPDEKIVVFSAFNNALLPKMSQWLDEWGVNHVVYAGSQAQRQAAQDAFVNDPDVRVFISSDAGSDSINLQVASVVVNYDLPWKWATLIQRQNRIHRITSTFSTVRFYTLMMADSVEDRIHNLLALKQSYHVGTFKGAISDQSTSARMSKADLLFVLGG